MTAIADDPSRYVMLFSGGEAGKLHAAGALDGASCTWSLWSGYLDEPSGLRLTKFLTEYDIPFAQHQTSGHASAADLRKLADAIAPNRVVPIHTFGGDSYGEVTDVADVQADGVWWDV